MYENFLYLSVFSFQLLESVVQSSYSCSKSAKNLLAAVFSQKEETVSSQLFLSLSFSNCEVHVLCDLLSNMSSVESYNRHTHQDADDRDSTQQKSSPKTTSCHFSLSQSLQIYEDPPCGHQSTIPQGCLENQSEVIRSTSEDLDSEEEFCCWGSKISSKEDRCQQSGAVRASKIGPEVSQASKYRRGCIDERIALPDFHLSKRGICNSQLLEDSETHSNNRGTTTSFQTTSTDPRLRSEERGAKSQYPCVKSPIIL